MRRRHSRSLIIAVAALAIGGGGAPLPGQTPTRLLIVSGLGGSPQYTPQFRAWGLALVDAARTRFALPDSDVVYLAEAGAPDRRIGGTSTRANVEAALARIAAGTPRGGQVMIILIGHGSGSEAATKISLPGPDMTAADFARALASLAGQTVAFVNMTSASGDMLPVLSGPNRVIITATKSSFERNESLFANQFVGALTGDGADTDKDGRVSLLEAYLYAVTETRRIYETQSLLLTEHAQLDDDGDRVGTAMPDGRALPGKGDGALARRFYLGGGRAIARATTGDTTRAGASSDPRLAALYRERDALEARVDSLRARKETMDPDAYAKSLEDLLTALALKAREIRALEGRGR